MLKRAVGIVFMSLLASGPINASVILVHNAESSAVVTQSGKVKGSVDLSTCTSFPCPAGYSWYYFSDPNCEDNPDSFDAYIEYWNEDETFAYDVYAGHSSYECANSTLGSSWYYQNCLDTSPWNCQDLGWTWNPHP